MNAVCLSCQFPLHFWKMVMLWESVEVLLHFYAPHKVASASIVKAAIGRPLRSDQRAIITLGHSLVILMQ